MLKKEITKTISATEKEDAAKYRHVTYLDSNSKLYMLLLIERLDTLYFSATCSDAAYLQY